MNIRIALFLLLSLTVLALASFTVMVRAQDVPATSSAPMQATESDDPDSLRMLRDKLASVVAELRKKDEQVVAGEVRVIEPNYLEIDTIAGVVQKVELDEALTKYFRVVGAAKEEIEPKDMVVGAYVLVTGLRTDGSFTANEVYIDEHFESKAGRVTELDATNLTLRLETFDKDILTVSVARSTTQELINASGTLEASIFSRIKEGDTVHVVYAVSSLRTPVSAVTPTRLLVIPMGYLSK